MSDTHRPGVVMAGSLLSGPPASRTSTLIDGSALNRCASTHPADPAPMTTKSKAASRAGDCPAAREGSTAADTPMVLMKSRRFMSAFQMIDKLRHSRQRALTAHQRGHLEQAWTDHAAGEREPGAVDQRSRLDAARLGQRPELLFECRFVPRIELGELIAECAQMRRHLRRTQVFGDAVRVVALRVGEKGRQLIDELRQFLAPRPQQ